MMLIKLATEGLEHWHEGRDAAGAFHIELTPISLGTSSHVPMLDQNSKPEPGDPEDLSPT